MNFVIVDLNELVILENKGIIVNYEQICSIEDI